MTPPNTPPPALVVVANRLPIRRIAATAKRPERWERSPGGLVSALAPAISSRPTTWIGWSGTPDDAAVPERRGKLGLVAVPVSASEQEQYYEGFSNGTLWPLYHDAIFTPEFHDRWWSAYDTVNRRFADVTADAAPHGATVWIHDYQLHLVPALLRARRPDLRIGFFLHIPFPSQELFLRIPWRREITEGMLGADVVGFQTSVGAHNFRLVAERLVGAQVCSSSVLYDGREVTVDRFPIGIDAAAITALAAEPATAQRAEQIRHDLGSPTTLLLGVDRLDYTKGIDVRLRALEELFTEGRLDPEATVLVQIAQPSRGDAPGYAQIRRDVERTVGRINGAFGVIGHTPIRYMHRGQSLRELVALYTAADVMLVTPFRDGMNLVAKEYVAAKRDHGGTLILSEFAGAAHELTDAVHVNPFDVQGLKRAIETAVHHPADDRAEGMQRMFHQVAERDAATWSNEFLATLEGAR